MVGGNNNKLVKAGARRRVIKGVQQFQPHLSLFFNCGCKCKLGNDDEAAAHVSEFKHAVSVTGNLGMSLRYSKFACNGHKFTDLSFSCGDGFQSYSMEKAEEHVRKTYHKLKVNGKLAPAIIASAIGQSLPDIRPILSKPIKKAAGEEGDKNIRSKKI